MASGSMGVQERGVTMAGPFIRVTRLSDGGSLVIHLPLVNSITPYNIDGQCDWNYGDETTRIGSRIDFGVYSDDPAAERVIAVDASPEQILKLDTSGSFKKQDRVGGWPLYVNADNVLFIDNSLPDTPGLTDIHFRGLTSQRVVGAVGLEGVELE
jgi:hypothetical protein